VGDCLLWVCFLKITEVDMYVARIIGLLTYFHSKSCVFIFDKCRIGLHFGQIFLNASGHPEFDMETWIPFLLISAKAAQVVEKRFSAEFI
jgi:hypothetical protein